ERIVLHVASADLEDIGIIGDKSDLFRRHYFRDDGEAGHGAGLGEQLEALLLESLEAVGAGARLVGAAAQAAAARLADEVGDLEDLLAALDRAGPGDDTELSAADAQAQGLDDGWLLLDFVAGDLVRREDWDHFLPPFPQLERLLGAIALLAQRGDHRAFGPDDDLTAQAELVDALDHVLNLLLAGTRFHDDDHVAPPPAGPILFPLSPLGRGEKPERPADSPRGCPGDEPGTGAAR